MFRNLVTVVAVTALLFAAIPGVAVPAAATPQNTTATPTADNSGDNGEEEDTDIINIDVSGIIDAIEDLGGNLVDKIKSAIFAPFDAFAKAVINILTHLFTSYPTIHPNEDVRELHRLSLIVAFALSTLTIVVAGLLFQVGPLFGVSYQQVRLILPRVLLALIFSTVSPYLLQYTVDFADALTHAFKPADPGVWEATRILTELALVAVLDAFLLATIGALFVVRDIYLLFAAVASPLIALGWALPYTRRYANTLIGVYWSFLLIGPLDMIVFRLTLSLLETSNGGVPQWLTAMGGIVMMLGIPYILLTTGQSMAVALGGLFDQARPHPVRTGHRWLTHRSDRNNRRDSHDRPDSGGRRRGARQRYRDRRTAPPEQRSDDPRDNQFRDMLPEDYDQ